MTCLIETPQLALVLKQGLNLNTELVKYAKVKALVGGETTLQGAVPSVETGRLARAQCGKHQFWATANSVSRAVDRQLYRRTGCRPSHPNAEWSGGCVAGPLGGGGAR
jgi:hypothetical protein